MHICSVLEENYSKSAWSSQTNTYLHAVTMNMQQFLNYNISQALWLVQYTTWASGRGERGLLDPGSMEERRTALSFMLLRENSLAHSLCVNRRRGWKWWRSTSIMSCKHIFCTSNEKKIQLAWNSPAASTCQRNDRYPKQTEKKQRNDWWSGQERCVLGSNVEKH